MNKTYSNSSNEIIKLIFSKSISPYKRDFGRNRYHVAQKFWALVLRFILSNKRNKNLLYIGLRTVVKTHAVLFYDALRFEYKCYQFLDGKDRDWINSFRDTNEYQQLVYNSAELYQTLINTLFRLTGELKDSFSSDTINYLSLSIKEHPQPYLLSPEQVLEVLAAELQVEVTEKKILWPLRNLTPTELKELEEMMKSIFFNTMLDRIAQHLIEFDGTFGVTFLPFNTVTDEMEAINSFSGDSKYNYDLIQTKYILETTYRKENGELLHSENLGRYLRRYFDG